MPKPIASAPPSAQAITDEDRRRVSTYLRLLDAADVGAPWEEICTLVLHLDPVADPARAKALFDAWMARAAWLADQGWRDLLAARSQG